MIVIALFVGIVLGFAGSLFIRGASLLRELEDSQMRVEFLKDALEQVKENLIISNITAASAIIRDTLTELREE